MREHDVPSCQECGEDMFELDAEFYCPSCDSVSGFELVPDRESFEL